MQKIHEIYIIEVKKKTKYKTFISPGKFTPSVDFIVFKGVEVDIESEDLGSYNNIKKILDNGELVERFFPWSSVLEIQVKRYKEE